MSNNIKRADLEAQSFEKFSKPKVSRFKQSTHHRPRTTRRDKLAAAALVAELEG